MKLFKSVLLAILILPVIVHACDYGCCAAVIDGTCAGLCCPPPDTCAESGAAVICSDQGGAPLEEPNECTASTPCWTGCTGYQSNGTSGGNLCVINGYYNGCTMGSSCTI